VLIRIVHTVLLFLALLPLRAQVNLVPNPGFDEFDQCPTTGGDITGYVKDWYRVSNTPDYLNACSPTMGVPSSPTSYQPSRSGLAYMGAGVYTSNNLINVPLEMFRTKLAEELVAGKKYCVSFFVNPSNSSGYSINCYEAYFSTDMPLYPGNVIDNSVIPQISNMSGIISDTLGWTEVSGSFIAEGGESHITLGCFKALVGVDTIRNTYNQTSIFSNGAYSFFEDVSVVYCDKTTLDDIVVPNIFTPNHDGTNDLFRLSSQGDSIAKKLHMVIYNRWGAEVYKTDDAIGEPWDGKTPFGSTASTGVYYYILHDEKNTKSGFVQVSH